MARKSLSDFGNDYQAYANYLESAECANDEGYDTYVDIKGNIYQATRGDWTLGHGHNNVNDSRDPRDPDDPSSIGRPWRNPWLKYIDRLNLTSEEIIFLYSNNYLSDFIETDKNKLLSKKM